MSYNTTFNADGANSPGGKIVAIKRVNADTTAIANQDWFNFPVKIETNIKIARPKEDKIDEAGDVYKREPGNKTCEFRIKIAQNDSNTLNFLLNETEDTYYAAIMHIGSGLLNTSKYVYAPLCQFDEGFEVTFKGGEIDTMLKPQLPAVAWNANSLTSSSASVTGWNTQFGITNPASLSASLSGNGTKYIAIAEA